MSDLPQCDHGGFVAPYWKTEVFVRRGYCPDCGRRLLDDGTDAPHEDTVRAEAAEQRAAIAEKALELACRQLVDDTLNAPESEAAEWKALLLSHAKEALTRCPPSS